MENKSNASGCVIFAAVALGIFLLYYIVIAMAKVCVYLGYNMSFYTDNMLMVQGLSPILAWGILGLFTGSIAGIIIAIKKLQLSWLLLLYPVGITTIFMTIMILVNKPGLYAVQAAGPAITTANADTTALSSLKYYCIVTSNISVYSSPGSYKKKLFLLRKNSKVELLGKFRYPINRNVWLKIRYNNQEGYVNSNGLKYSNSSY